MNTLSRTSIEPIERQAHALRRQEIARLFNAGSKLLGAVFASISESVRLRHAARHAKPAASPHAA